MRRCRFSKELVAAGLMLMVSAGSSAAAEGLTLSAGHGAYPLNTYLEWIPEADPDWTPGIFLTGTLDDRFLASPERIDLGASSLSWFRFKVDSVAPAAWFLMLDFQFLQDACVYWPVSRGFEEKCLREKDGSIQPPVRHRHHLFPMPKGLSPKTYIYFSIHSGVPVKIAPTLISKNYLYDSVIDHQMTAGLCYGALLALVLFNLFLFFGTRDLAYLFFSLHIGIFGFMAFGYEGLAAVHFWPTRAGDIEIYCASLALVFSFGALYVKRFLELEDSVTWMGRGFLVTIGIGSIAVPVAFVDVALCTRLVGIAILLFTALSIVGSVLRLRSGYRPALFLLVAQSVFLVAVVIGALPILGVRVPIVMDIAEMRMAMVVNALLLSFGLADRVKSLADEKARLVPELEARNTEMERFLYMVSHDLRNPLVTIKIFVGMLKKNVDTSGAKHLREDLDHVSAAATQMDQVLRDLLELSRAGLVDNNLEDVELGEVICEATDLVVDELHRRHACLEIGRDLPTVRVDHERLVEVFRNLIDNAVKFMGAQESPRIEIGGERQDDEVLCFVRDNGMGIPQRFHDKIFDPFERLEADGDGTGMGLALVRRIIDHHGGRAWVESEGEGTGSTFYFTLRSSTL